MPQPAAESCPSCGVPGHVCERLPLPLPPAASNEPADADDVPGPYPDLDGHAFTPDDAHA